MSEPFRASLLLSMPQLLDPNFSRTVVLLCDYNSDGAFGLIVNRPSDMPASEMVNLQPPVVPGNALRLWFGGPVEPQRGWILLGDEPDAEFKRISDGLYLSMSPEILRHVLEASPAPRARILAGYAGWGPGQLDEELSHSSWLMADVDPDLLFETPAEQMWETAIRRLGADTGSLTTSHGVH
jgi:putative transcriptional regulator